jgi:hypothetical protein
MLALDVIKNPKDTEPLLVRAEEVLAYLRNYTCAHDIFIMFHPETNRHHFFAHASQDKLLLKDLLFVSDSYLARLAEVYDAVLLKKLADIAIKQSPSSSKDFFKILQTPEIEANLFLINAAKILSLHVQQGKTVYSPDITQDVTNKNILSMVEAGYTAERARLILGNASPYREELYSEEFNASDHTARRLFEATDKHQDNLRIPNLESHPNRFAEKPIQTPDFSKKNWWEKEPTFNEFLRCALNVLQTYDVNISKGQSFLEKTLVKGLEAGSDNLLENQLNKFLPAREDLKKQFWEKYSHAQCVLPER